MSEYRVYGKDGLFHNIVKNSTVMAGRYAVLPKGGPDLNINSLLSGLELPEKFKFPGVFCTPPFSEGESLVNGWETINFRMLFLCTTHATGDNQIKSRDPLTNSSLHTIPMDWSDMKKLALTFMHALHESFSLTREFFRLSGRNGWRIARISGIQNMNVSGVMLTFSGQIPIDCVYTDIDLSTLEIPADIHANHFH